MLANLRDKVQKNPIIGVVLAVVVIGVAAAVIVTGGDSGSGGRDVDGVWFYNLETQKLVKAPLNTDSPQEDGTVAAFVYACGDCSDPARHEIAYLQKYDDETIAQIRGGKPATLDQGMNNRYVRTVDGEWVKISSEEGSRISGQRIKCPAGVKPKACFPGK